MKSIEFTEHEIDILERVMQNAVDEVGKDCQYSSIQCYEHTCVYMKFKQAKMDILKEKLDKYELPKNV